MCDFDYDLFISHASEDKVGFVCKLVALLEADGLRVWFDEAELQVGDGLVESVEDGLRRSRFGVVVLSSRAFSEKRWAIAELAAEPPFAEVVGRRSSSRSPVVSPSALP